MAYKCIYIDEVEKVVITQPYKGKSAFMTRQFKNKKSLIISQLHDLKMSNFKRYFIFGNNINIEKRDH